MLAESSRRCALAGCASWVFHHEADARALPFGSNTFDASRSERLFQHLDDPQVALREMIRVTRPGGWIVVLDTDWASTSIDTSDTELEHLLIRAGVEHVFKNPYAGRQLHRLFHANGLDEISVEIRPQYSTSYGFSRYVGMLDRLEDAIVNAGLVTAARLAVWHEALEQADARGVFFAYLSMMLVSGRKPASVHLRETLP
jgi:SAM-dependent methyltransferase